MKIKQNALVKVIVSACFPDYKGRKFRTEVFRPQQCVSCWDGGSRDYFVLLNIATMRGQPIRENGSPFTAPLPRLESLPDKAHVLVERSIFCGKESGITIHCSQELYDTFAAHEIKPA
jgi:hypothetical protein